MLRDGLLDHGVEGIRTYETSVIIYRTGRSEIPEDVKLQQDRCEHLKY